MSLPVDAIALKAFADAELVKLDEQRKEAIKASGGLPYLPKLAVGETLVVLEAELPKDTLDPNKNARKQFVARYPGNQERYAWNVNPHSPLYRELLVNLTASPCVIKVVRTGTGANDTRYSVKFDRRVEAGQ